ncbi:MAG: hypothetical protein ACRD3S_07370, partial [Terracidiphilus sp.]
MSKSLGNYVGITEAPSEMFGKLMSISDELMWSYYELLTDFPSNEIMRLRNDVREGTLHPMDAKMRLAHAIAAGFHGEEEAKKAADEFQRVFRDRQAPEDPVECRIGTLEGGIVGFRVGTGVIVEQGIYNVGPTGKTKLSRLLVLVADISSKS